MIDFTGIDHGRLDKGEMQQFRATPLPVSFRWNLN